MTERSRRKESIRPYGCKSLPSRVANVVIHGIKWHRPNKTKCGRARGSLTILESLKMVGTTEIHKVTCADCKKAHQPGKV